MEKTEIGDTGIFVSRLGLGTVKFGRNEGVKYPRNFELPDDKTLEDLLAEARKLGLNLLDTAPSYGQSEERLGELLKGQRREWVIAGKAGEDFEDGVSRYTFTSSHFEKSLERSLKRLQTEYLDILLIHSDGNDLKILSDDALMKTMEGFKRQGLVRAIGASTKTAAGGLKALETMDVVMATYNKDHTDEQPILDYAHRHRKGVLLKKILGSGHATDIHGAMDFAFGHPGASAAIVGTINAQHLRQNVQAARAALQARAASRGSR